MADAKEMGGYMSTATGLCLNFSDFAPEWVVLQTILFLISTGLAVFDTYTDWEVVLDFKDVGFNNPLLPPNDHWLRAWLLFASIGTFLTFISFLQDGHSLLYTMYGSCKKRCCKSSTPKETYELDDFKDKEKEGRDAEDDDDIDDPCKCCYHCGCNSATRNETLGAITLWFQDVPMLTIGVLYAFSQSTCKVPEVRDVTPVLQDIGISAAAATLAASWRTLRSFIRLYTSVGARIKDQNSCLRKCVPKAAEVIYPPDTKIQCCLIPFFVGLLFQFFAIVAGASITAAIWYNYVQLQTPNFDDSLGIYRFTLVKPDVRLFEISGNIIPANGSFVNLEQIPARELEGADLDVFCLSEFQYRSEDFQIYFNVVQLKLVNEDGQFCTTAAGLDFPPNLCTAFYTILGSVLYYASVDPDTGEIERFDGECVVVRDIFNYHAGPVIDLGLDVNRHINRTGYPQNNEQLIVYYPPPIRAGLNVSEIQANEFGLRGISTFLDPAGVNITCVIEFEYSNDDNRINFNYRDITFSANACTCSPIFSPGPMCRQFHQNLVYAYVRDDGVVVPYTQCSTLPPEKIVPFHDTNMILACPEACTA